MKTKCILSIVTIVAFFVSGTAFSAMAPAIEMAPSLDATFDASDSDIELFRKGGGKGKKGGKRGDGKRGDRDGKPGDRDGKRGDGDRDGKRGDRDGKRGDRDGDRGDDNEER